jgi:hypothetical protein
LDDSWLLNAAIAWSSLRVLCLDELATVNVGTNFSLAGLIPLVKHCPKLQSLRLAVNARAIAPHALYGIYGQAMRSFFVGNGSTILRPQQVMRSLATLFPNLKKIRLGVGVINIEDWKVVQRLLEESAYSQP